MRKVSLFLELVLWRSRRWIIAPVDDCDGHFCHLLDSLPLVMGEQIVGRMSCLPLVRRADHRPCPVSEVLELSSPSRHGRSKGPSYPGRRRTSKSKTVVPQRQEFESRCDSTLPYPSPVLGMATAVWNLPASAPDGLVTWCTREVARGVYDYEMTAKLCQLLSAGDVAQEAGLIGIDRWMLRRSYCVCVWRLTSVCVVASAQLSD